MSDHFQRAALLIFDRHPILDVVTGYDAANALYLAAGWTNAGEVEMRFVDGTVLLSYVYLAPLIDMAVHLQ